MLKKSLYVAGAAVLLLGLLFGRDAIGIVTTSVGQLRQQVKDSVPVGAVAVEFEPASEPDWPDWRVVRYGEGRTGIALPAGPVRWSVRWPDPRTGRPVVREGDATVEARAVTVVEIDLR